MSILLLLIVIALFLYAFFYGYKPSVKAHDYQVREKLLNNTRLQAGIKYLIKETRDTPYHVLFNYRAIDLFQPKLNSLKLVGKIASKKVDILIVDADFQPVCIGTQDEFLYRIAQKNMLPAFKSVKEMATFVRTLKRVK